MSKEFNMAAFREAASRPRRQYKTPEGWIAPTHRLDEGGHMWVLTPHGMVYICAMHGSLGTSVSVYDHPHENPMSQCHIRPRAES